MLTPSICNKYTLVKHIKAIIYPVNIIVLGLLLLNSCAGNYSEKRQKKSPRIRNLSKVISPKSGTELVSSDMINFETALSQGTVSVDSTIVNYGVTQIASWKSGSHQVSASKLRAGNQRVSIVVHLSNGKKEKHTVGLKILPSSSPEQYTYRTINTFVHDPDAYTQGLLVDGNHLIESTGHRGESTLKRVDLESGKTIQQIDLDPQYFGEGITTFGDQIYMLTWTSNTGFIYNKSDFSQIGTFTYPTEGWGITAVGDTLFMSDGSENIYLMEPGSFTQLSKIQVYDDEGPVDRLNELEYINGKIYANRYETDDIIIIDPKTGFVTGVLSLTGIFNKKNYNRKLDVLNGIAYDQKLDKIFVTGKWWPKLFEIQIIPTSDAIN